MYISIYVLFSYATISRSDHMTLSGIMFND